MPPLVDTTTARMRSPIDTSMSPSSSLSSASSICASLFAPTLTKATSWPNATMVPSMVWPCSNRRALTDASNIVAKSSSCSLTEAPSFVILVREAVDQVIHAELVRLIRLIEGPQSAAGPLPELRDIGVVVDDRHQTLAGIVVFEDAFE